MDEVIDPTNEFYANNAQTYADKGVREENLWLAGFMGLLPFGAKILELGCGAGRESALMLARGFDVTATDGTPELAAIAAQNLGRDVQVLRFDAIEFDQAFDGIFANACLLHARRSELPDILSRIARSLKAGGVFYSSYKAGDAEGHDALGRFYNYPSNEWLAETFNASQVWESVEITAEDGSAYDRLPTRWLHVMARKKADNP
jgi:SAM-dependent methyltransferase